MPGAAPRPWRPWPLLVALFFFLDGGGLAGLAGDALLRGAAGDCLARALADGLGVAPGERGGAGGADPEPAGLGVGLRQGGRGDGARGAEAVAQAGLGEDLDVAEDLGLVGEAPRAADA